MQTRLVGTHTKLTLRRTGYSPSQALVCFVVLILDDDSPHPHAAAQDHHPKETEASSLVEGQTFPIQESPHGTCCEDLGESCDKRGKSS